VGAAESSAGAGLNGIAADARLLELAELRGLRVASAAWSNNSSIIAQDAIGSGWEGALNPVVVRREEERRRSSGLLTSKLPLGTGARMAG